MKLIIITLALLCVIPAILHCQESTLFCHSYIVDPDFATDARAIALGRTGSISADSYSNLFQNPGLMSKSNKSGFSISARLNTTHADADVWTDDDTGFMFNTAGVVVAIPERFTGVGISLGAGVQILSDGRTDRWLPEDDAFYRQDYNTYSLTTYGISVSLGEEMGIGVTVSNPWNVRFTILEMFDSYHEAGIQSPFVTIGGYGKVAEGVELGMVWHSDITFRKFSTFHMGVERISGKNWLQKQVPHSVDIGLRYERDSKTDVFTEIHLPLGRETQILLEKFPDDGFAEYTEEEPMDGFAVKLGFRYGNFYYGIYRSWLINYNTVAAFDLQEPPELAKQNVSGLGVSFGFAWDYRFFCIDYRNWSAPETADYFSWDVTSIAIRLSFNPSM